jgi:hypothetical protein
MLLFYLALQISSFQYPSIPLNKKRKEIDNGISRLARLLSPPFFRKIKRSTVLNDRWSIAG